MRIGNGAYNQLQLDIYGELMDAVYLSNKYGDSISHDSWHNLQRILEWLSQNWQRPDEGIWEVRGPRRDFVQNRTPDPREIAGCKYFVGVCNINQMMRDTPAALLRQLRRADVEEAVDLHRVAIDHFAIEASGNQAALGVPFECSGEPLAIAADGAFA